MKAQKTYKKVKDSRSSPQTPQSVNVSPLLNQTDMQKKTFWNFRLRFRPKVREKSIRTTIDLCEAGEYSSKIEELQYLMDGIQSANISTVKSSLLQLVEQCTFMESRFLVRSQGLVDAVMEAILCSLCKKDQILTFATSVLFFVLYTDKSHRYSIPLEFLTTLSNILLDPSSSLLLDDTVLQSDELLHKIHNKVVKMLQECKKEFPTTLWSIDPTPVNIFLFALDIVVQRQNDYTGTPTQFNLSPQIVQLKENLLDSGLLYSLARLTVESISVVFRINRKNIRPSVHPNELDHQSKHFRIIPLLRLLEMATFMNSSNQFHLSHMDKIIFVPNKVEVDSKSKTRPINCVSLVEKAGTVVESNHSEKQEVSENQNEFELSNYVNIANAQMPPPSPLKKGRFGVLKDTFIGKLVDALTVIEAWLRCEFSETSQNIPIVLEASLGVIRLLVNLINENMASGMRFWNSGGFPLCVKVFQTSLGYYVNQRDTKNSDVKYGSDLSSQTSNHSQESFCHSENGLNEISSEFQEDCNYSRTSLAEKMKNDTDFHESVQKKKKFSFKSARKESLHSNDHNNPSPETPKTGVSIHESQVNDSSNVALLFSFDFLVLSIGLLINCSEVLTDSRIAISSKDLRLPPKFSLHGPSFVDPKSKEGCPPHGNFIPSLLTLIIGQLSTYSTTNSQSQTQKNQDSQETASFDDIQSSDIELESGIIVAYSSLLLGHLIRDCQENAAILKAYLTVEQMSRIVSFLQTFLVVQSEAGLPNHILQGILNVIHYLSCILQDMNKVGNSVSLPIGDSRNEKSKDQKGQIKPESFETSSLEISVEKMSPSLVPAVDKSFSNETPHWIISKTVNTSTAVPTTDYFPTKEFVQSNTLENGECSQDNSIDRCHKMSPSVQSNRFWSTKSHSPQSDPGHNWSDVQQKEDSLDDSEAEINVSNRKRRNKRKEGCGLLNKRKSMRLAYSQ